MTISKKKTYKFAKQLGIPIPKTFYPKRFKELEILKQNLTYPCVIKGLYEVGGNIVDYAYSKEELTIKYVSICDKFNITEQDGLPMLQEYITGKGCAFFAIYNKGKCCLTFQHERVREFPVSGGSSVCAKSTFNAKIELYGKKILDALEWNGVAMVEFKYNDKKEPILMEINPKFWGSLDLAIASGVNFPKALLDIKRGKTLNFERKYKYPLKYHWLLHGDLIHGVLNPKNLFPVLFDTLSYKVKGNLWVTDIRPTFKMFFIFFASFLRKIVNIFNS